MRYEKSNFRLQIASSDPSRCNIIYQTIRRSLTTDSTNARVQAFCELPPELTSCRRRLVFGTRRHGHITPVFTTIRWLTFRQRLTFKTSVLVWKCLLYVAPRYLADLCVRLWMVVVSHVLQSVLPS